jgi:hypothetical protein
MMILKHIFKKKQQHPFQQPKEENFQPIYHCSCCGSDATRRFASKRTWLQQLPPVLPVQLKRFRFDAHTGSFQMRGEMDGFHVGFIFFNGIISMGIILIWLVVSNKLRAQLLPVQRCSGAG